MNWQPRREPTSFSLEIQPRHRERLKSMRSARNRKPAYQIKFPRGMRRGRAALVRSVDDTLHERRAHSVQTQRWEEREERGIERIRLLSKLSRERKLLAGKQVVTTYSTLGQRSQPHSGTEYYNAHLPRS